jgi:hypothetical protein
MHMDHHQNASRVLVNGAVSSSLDGITYHDTLAERTSSIDVGNTRMDMHAYWHPVFDENLLEEHPGNFTCLHICVRYKMSVRSIGAGPAKAEALFLRCPWLNKNVSLTWYFRLDTTAKGLVSVRVL